MKYYLFSRPYTEGSLYSTLSKAVLVALDVANEQGIQNPLNNVMGGDVENMQKV